jgi:hypothetical protein
VTEKEGLEGVEEAGGMADPSQQKMVAVMSTLEDAVAVITAVFHNNRQNHPINSISKRGRVAVVEARGGPVRRH